MKQLERDDVTDNIELGQRVWTGLWLENDLSIVDAVAVIMHRCFIAMMKRGKIVEIEIDGKSTWITESTAKEVGVVS